MMRRSPDEVRAMATHIIEGRLGMLGAIVAAVERYPEVVAAVAGARDRSDARAVVGTLLGVEEMPARAVLELRWEDLHARSRQAFSQEHHDLAAELARRQPNGTAQN
jgi:DNA gyrase/topoisomerase IV subunit A